MSRKPFAILSPQAEVVVAPKVRQPVPMESEGAFDLTGARNSVASTSKSKRLRRKAPDPSLHLRTICLPHPTFEDELLDSLCVYVSPFMKSSPVFSGGMTKISIVPSPSKPPTAPEKEKEKENAASNETEFAIAKQVVVKVQAWEEAPEHHIGLSPQLAATLGIHGIGNIAKYLS
jgi:peroxin-1